MSLESYEKPKIDFMALKTTNYDRFGLSDSEKNTSSKNKLLKPSKRALRFVLDYAKSSSVTKVNGSESIILMSN